MLDDFLKILHGERPDGVVWTADLSYWINGRQHDGTADPAWQTEAGYLQLHRELGVMPYYYYDKFWTFKAIYSPCIDVSVNNSKERTVRTINSPIGTLREESAFMPESCCHGIVKHLVETESDLDIMLHLLDRRRLEPANLLDYPQRQTLWANHDGIPCLGLPRSPLSAFTYEWAGLQNMVMLMLDCEHKVRQALHLMELQEAPIINAVCELAPPLVHFPDNLSSDNLTSYYDPHMRARHRARLDKLHRAGVKAAVHLDGTVRGLLPKLLDAGFDAVEALTPKPAGDLSVDDMHVLAADRPGILWGGVPGAMFAPPYTWHDMQAHVEHVLATWQDRPFILGVADQVPPDGNIDLCRQIAAILP